MKDLVSEGFANVVKPYIDNEIATRAILGAYNLDIPIAQELVNVTISRTNNGYNVASTSSGTWTNAALYYKLPKNADIKLITTVSHTSGNPRIAIYGNSIPSERGRTSIIVKEITADGLVEVSFNTGNYEYICVGLFASLNTSAQGDVTYSDFIIKLADDAYTEYVEPAMTNRELTEILSDVGTYNVPVIMGSAQSSYVRGAIPYHDKTAKHTVTLNSAKQFADSTDYTSQFSVDYSNAGFAIIYSPTVALAGALMNVNVTIS